MKKIFIGMVLALHCALPALNAHAQVDSDAILKEAQALRLGGEPNQALGLYNSLIEQQAGNVDALVGRGYTYLLMGKKYDEALKDFEHVTRLAPDYIDAYMGQAMVYKRRGEFSQATSILEAARRRISDDPAKMRALAEAARQAGFYNFARRTDREYRPEKDNNPQEHPHEMSLNYGYDFIDERNDWWEMNFAYRYRPKLDQEVRFFYSDFTRDTDRDYHVGLGYSYHWDQRTSLSYDVFLSGQHDFVARQKHRPRIYFNLPHQAILGLGGNFDEFETGWLAASHTQITKYFGSFYGKYTYLGGKDGPGQDIASYIGELGYERDDAYSIRLGYGAGNESLDRGAREIDADVDIDTYFISSKLYITKDWGVLGSVSREYRDEDYFRTSGMAGLFYKF